MSIAFYKDRLRQVEKRLASNSDFVEAQVLRKVISELTNEPVVTIKRPYTKRSASTKPRAGRGTRMKNIYEIVEKIVATNNGRASMKEIIQTLKDQHGAAWKALGRNDSVRGSQIPTYIRHCNKYLTPHRLFLWPNKAAPGKVRISRYTDVLAPKFNAALTK